MGKKIDFQKAAQREREKRERQLWQALCRPLHAIVELWPWGWLEPEDPFLFITKSGDRAVYFSCVQEEENDVEILIFPSPRDYQCAFHQRQTIRQEIRNFIEMEQYTVSLVHWEALPGEVGERYRHLGLDFGDGLWPWVTGKHRGYLDTDVQGEELAFVADCLGNFLMQLRAIQEEGMRPEFQKGDMMLRFYSARENLWMNVVEPLEFPADPGNPVVFRPNSSKLRAMQGLGRSATHRKVEFDFGWQQEPEEDGCFWMEVLLTDRETGELLCLYRCRPEELMNCAFTAWREVVEEHGIPSTLYLCRDESCDLFEDLAQKMGVKIKRVKRLPAAERILRDLGAV